MRCLFCLFLISCWVSAGRADDNVSVQDQINVTTSDMLAPMSDNWLSYNGDYSGRRYSPLSQINVKNANQLRTEWIFHSRNSDHLEVTPVVVNGTMFVTSANDVFALDSQTGRMVWHYARPISEGLIDVDARLVSSGVGVCNPGVNPFADHR